MAGTEVRPSATEADAFQGTTQLPATIAGCCFPEGKDVRLTSCVPHEQKLRAEKLNGRLSPFRVAKTSRGPHPIQRFPLGYHQGRMGHSVFQVSLGTASPPLRLWLRWPWSGAHARRNIATMPMIQFLSTAHPCSSWANSMARKIGNREGLQQSRKDRAASTEPLHRSSGNFVGPLRHGSAGMRGSSRL